jgi:deoxycytidine triphosphate deaminase
MLLNKDQIKNWNNSNLVQGASDKRFRAASYDLEIGRIIDHKGKEVDQIDIEAQGMVRVISRERVKLPQNVSGYATVKTSLCDEGILAINIGILDPGYDGLLSSTLINFGRSPYPLKIGDVFLRLTFHEITAPVDAPIVKPTPDEDYVSDKKKLVRRDFSPTFLNIEETAIKAAERVVGAWKSKVLLGVSVFALLFTAGAALATTWSALTATRVYIQSDQERLKTELRDLQLRIRELEKPSPPHVASQETKQKIETPRKAQ